MRIQAYRRNEPFSVNLAPRGLTEQLVQFYLLDKTSHIVADVSDDLHIKMLLNVPEAYREYAAKSADFVPPVDTEAERNRKAAEDLRAAQLRDAEQKQQINDAQEKARRNATQNGTLIGSNIQPTTISLTGSKTVPLGEVVAAAHRASGLSLEEWNELQGDEREAMISSMVGQMEVEAEAHEAAEMEALRIKAEEDEAALAAKQKAEQEAAEAAKFTLIAQDKSVIDLKPMSDTKLREFAKTYGVDLPPGIKGDAIRQVIVDKLAPVAGDEAAK